MKIEADEQPYLEATAINAVIEVLSGRANQAEIQAYENHWPMKTWRAAIRHVIDSGNQIAMDDLHLMLNDGEHNRYDLQPGMIVGFTDFGYQRGEITDRITGARKVMYRIVNLDGFRGSVLSGDVSTLIDANAIERVERIMPQKFNLYPDVRFFQHQPSGDVMAMLESEMTLAGCPAELTELPYVDPERRVTLIAEMVNNLAGVKGL